MNDLRQSPQYARFMSSIGWTTKTIKRESASIFVYIRKLPLLPFSVMKVQRFNSLLNYDAIKNIASKHHALSVTLEPSLIPGATFAEISRIMRKQNYRNSRSPLLPTKTIRVLLKKSGKKLLAQMTKDARASIGKARRICDIGLASYDDQKSVTGFYRFFSRWGKGYIPKLSDFQALLKAFEHDVFIVSCFSKQGLLLAGTVILIADDCAYYYFAVTSPQGRRTFAGYLAVWEAMREAKRRGCRFFDFEGIYDDRFNQLKRWRGFSSFKKKFAGKTVEYPGPFVRNFSFLSLLSFLGFRK